MSFRPKVVAVTGGAQGIGRAAALHFARAGYAVSIIDSNRVAGAKTLRELGSGRAIFTAGDISSQTQVRRWLSLTKTKLGCPDVLINNAGIMANKPILTLKLSEMMRVLGVNLIGTFLSSQIAARQMAAAGRAGCIINIASTRAFMSEPGTEAYTASKGGIAALTHGMAISLGPLGIRVNCISPGWIEVRGLTHSKEDREQHPVGRVGKPEDIAEACFFLAERAGFMTGQNIIIDGGMSVKMIYED